MAATSRVVVDGSNIATEGRSTPSLAQLRDAVAAYKAEHPDEVLTVVVDASFSYRIDESERSEFERARTTGEFVSPPAGAIGRGDGFLLQIADRTGARVLSNDSFQEYHGEYEWLFERGRLIGATPVPDVGWFFTLRTPIRGAKSREAVKEAKKRARRTKPIEEAIAEATEDVLEPASSRARRRRRRSKGPPPEAVNDPVPFITFVASHPLGSEVAGVVERFSSHGAFVAAEGATCYLPLAGMGEPPPRSAREVLKRGEERSFVLQALDAPRRGIELALPGCARPAAGPTDETVEAEIEDRATTSSGHKLEHPGAPEIAEEEPVSEVPTRRARTRKLTAAVGDSAPPAPAINEAVEGVLAPYPGKLRPASRRRKAVAGEEPAVPQIEQRGQGGGLAFPEVPTSYHAEGEGPVQPAPAKRTRKKKAASESPPASRQDVEPEEAAPAKRTRKKKAPPPPSGEVAIQASAQEGAPQLGVVESAGETPPMTKRAAARKPKPMAPPSLEEAASETPGPAKRTRKKKSSPIEPGQAEAEVSDSAPARVPRTRKASSKSKQLASGAQVEGEVVSSTPDAPSKESTKKATATKKAAAKKAAAKRASSRARAAPSAEAEA